MASNGLAYRLRGRAHRLLLAMMLNNRVEAVASQNLQAGATMFNEVKEGCHMAERQVD